MNASIIPYRELIVFVNKLVDNTTTNGGTCKSSITGAKTAEIQAYEVGARDIYGALCAKL